MQNKINPITGLKERSVKIDQFLKANNISRWGKPKGLNLFDRNA